MALPVRHCFTRCCWPDHCCSMLREEMSAAPDYLELTMSDRRANRFRQPCSTAEVPNFENSVWSNHGTGCLVPASAPDRAASWIALIDRAEWARRQDKSPPARGGCAQPGQRAIPLLIHGND